MTRLRMSFFGLQNQSSRLNCGHLPLRGPLDQDLSTLQRIDGPGDAELISAVRGGDVSAYGGCSSAMSGRASARARGPPGDVDDLVSDTFAKVLAYCCAAADPPGVPGIRADCRTPPARRQVRATSRLTSTDDMEAYETGEPFKDPAVAGFGTPQRRGPSRSCPSAGGSCCGTPRSRVPRPPTSRCCSA